MIDDLKTAVSVRYVVQLDESNLGEFTGCEGLGVEVVLETREEGGNNTFVWQFPTRLKYPNIKLSRPVYEGSSDKVLNWILSTTSGMKRSTGTIIAKNSKGAVVATLAQVVQRELSKPENQQKIKEAFQKVQQRRSGAK